MNGRPRATREPRVTSAGHAFACRNRAGVRRVGGTRFSRHPFLPFLRRTRFSALLADIRIAAENAEFGALERRWNIVGGDGLTARLPLVVGFSRAMELIITGRRIDVREAERIGLVNEIVPKGRALARAQELAHEIAALPQGAIRSDKETVLRGVGRTLEERLRIEAEMIISMFMRRDSHTLGAAAFKAGNLKPDWPNHGL